MGPYLNVEECAAYLRFTPKTIYNKTHRKEIPYRKHGRLVVFHKDEIDAWSLSHAKPVKEKQLSKFQEAKMRHEVRK